MLFDMDAHKGKTNFMRDFADESEQQHAYQEMLEYLVNAGNYPDVDEADNDASTRVKFCEEINLYDDDVQLKNSTIHLKKIQVLINANNLQDIIAENDGTLPDLSLADTAPPTLSRELDSNSSITDPAHESDVVVAASKNSSLEPLEKVVTGSRTVIEDSSSKKQNPILRAALYLGKSAIIVSALLASMMLLLSSEHQLQIIKYSFLLFAILMLLFIVLSEVRGKILKRLRFAVSHSLFITTACLSGLLFTQQQWNDATFATHSGLIGQLENAIIHSVLVIGPYGLAIFFSVMAFLIFIAIQATPDHKIKRPKE